MIGHGGVGTLWYCRLAGLPTDRRYDQLSQGRYFSVDLTTGRRPTPGSPFDSRRGCPRSCPPRLEVKGPRPIIKSCSAGNPRRSCGGGGEQPAQVTTLSPSVRTFGGRLALAIPFVALPVFAIRFVRLPVATKMSYVPDDAFTICSSAASSRGRAAGRSTADAR